LGQGWEPFAACLVGIAVLMAAYGLGWRAVRSGQVGRTSIWGFALLFAVTLFWLMPITADLFAYLSQAHLFTDLGRNPTLVAPLEGGTDPLLLAYSSPYATYPTVYGPAWVLLAAPGTLGPSDVAGGVWYLKGLATLSYLGCAWLLERILRQIRGDKVLQGLYLFAWNPLVLLLAVGDGHNDIVMTAMILSSLWLLLRERWVLAFGALALAFWIKYVGATLLPLCALYAWRRVRERRRAPGLTAGAAALAATGVSLLAVLPFCPLDSARAAGLWVLSILDRIVHPANWGAASPGVATWLMVAGLLLFAGALSALTWWLGRRPASYRRLADASFLALLFAFVLGAARSQPWHLIWVAALAGLSPRRWSWPVVAGLSALLLWGQVWVEWGAPGMNLFS
jgi:hypothetical protein